VARSGSELATPETEDARGHDVSRHRRRQLSPDTSAASPATAARVRPRLTDVTGLDEFRRLVEAMGAHLATRGLVASRLREDEVSE